MHDGFTLADLVTYNKKHNLSNGENNNDGENHNNSWNCGEVNFFVDISNYLHLGFPIHAYEKLMLDCIKCIQNILINECVLC